jgi:hypothetical protein
VSAPHPARIIKQDIAEPRWFPKTGRRVESCRPGWAADSIASPCSRLYATRAAGIRICSRTLQPDFRLQVEQLVWIWLSELSVIFSIVVILASAVMFLYWFRYTCLLLIERSNAEYALKVASTIQLSFPKVKETLQSHSHTASLDNLHRSLDNDYQLLMDVLGQAAGSTESIERRILAIDYKIMQTWYKITRTKNLVQARKALSEMSSILCYFAAEIGESAGA